MNIYKYIYIHILSCWKETHMNLLSFCCRSPKGYKKSGCDPRWGKRLKIAMWPCPCALEEPIASCSDQCLRRSGLGRTISTSGLFPSFSSLLSVRRALLCCFFYFSVQVRMEKVMWWIPFVSFDFVMKTCCSLDLPAHEPGHMGQAESQV